MLLQEINEPKEKVDEVCNVPSESSSSDDACTKYEDLNVRAKRLSDSLKRLSTQSDTINTIVENKDVEAQEEKETEEVQEILKRYSHILGKNYYNKQHNDIIDNITVICIFLSLVKIIKISVFIGDLDNSISSRETKEIPTSFQEGGKDASNAIVGDNQGDDGSKGSDVCLSKTPPFPTQITPSSNDFHDKIPVLDDDKNIHPDNYTATADEEKKQQSIISASTDCTTDRTVSDNVNVESQTKDKSDATSKTEAYSSNSALDVCKFNDESVGLPSEDDAKSLLNNTGSSSAELNLKQETKNTNSVDFPSSEIKVMNNSPSSNRKSNNIYTGLFSTTDVNDVDVTESAVLELDQESNSLSVNPEMRPANERLPEKELESNTMPNASNNSIGLKEDNKLTNGLEKLSIPKSKKTVSFRLDSSVDASQFTNVSLSEPEDESSDGKFENRFRAFVSYYVHTNKNPNCIMSMLFFSLLSHFSLFRRL